MMATPPVQLLQLPPLPVAVIQRTVRPAELSREVPACCGLVWTALKAQQAQAGRNVAIYWDGAIRLEAGVELLGTFQETGAIVRSATPGGLVATLTHLGPYGTMGVAHAAMLEWCKGEGHRLAGPSWELYGHWQESWDQDPSQIRTDICYLLAE